MYAKLEVDKVWFESKTKIALSAFKHTQASYFHKITIVENFICRCCYANGSDLGNFLMSLYDSENNASSDAFISPSLSISEN